MTDPTLSQYAKLMGSKGGKATASKMTPMERKIRALKASLNAPQVRAKREREALKK